MTAKEIGRSQHSQECKLPCQENLTASRCGEIMLEKPGVGSMPCGVGH